MISGRGRSGSVSQPVRLAAVLLAAVTDTESRATTHLFKSTRKEVTRNTSETGMKGVLSLYGNARWLQVKVTPSTIRTEGTNLIEGSSPLYQRSSVYLFILWWNFYLVCEEAGPSCGQVCRETDRWVKEPIETDGQPGRQQG